MNPTYNHYCDMDDPETILEVSASTASLGIVLMDEEHCLSLRLDREKAEILLKQLKDILRKPEAPEEVPAPAILLDAELEIMMVEEDVTLTLTSQEPVGAHDFDRFIDKILKDIPLGECYLFYTTLEGGRRCCVLESHPSLRDFRTTVRRFSKAYDAALQLPSVTTGRIIK